MCADMGIHMEFKEPVSPGRPNTWGLLKVDEVDCWLSLNCIPFKYQPL